MGSEAGKGRLLDSGRMSANDAKTVYMAFLFLQIGGDATFRISGTLYVGVIIGGCECMTLRRHM